jgi:hypothetical protein
VESKSTSTARCGRTSLVLVRRERRAVAGSTFLWPCVKAASVGRRPGLPDRDDQIELSYEGVHVVVRKQRVHQWRTDLMPHLNGKSFLLGRLEGGMTRREVKDLTRRWIREHQKH